MPEKISDSLHCGCLGSSVVRAPVMRSGCRGFKSRSGHLIFSGICSIYIYLYDFVYTYSRFSLCVHLSKRSALGITTFVKFYSECYLNFLIKSLLKLLVLYVSGTIFRIIQVDFSIVYI